MKIAAAEMRKYAKQCEACGQFTTANWLNSAADIVEVQTDTIKTLKAKITRLANELKKLGVDVHDD